MAVFPFETPVLRVQQPLGTYFVAILPSDILLEVAYSHVMSARLSTDGIGYVLDGTQRLADPKRIRQIADYVDRIDAAFPNAIVLAANFVPETGFVVDDDAAIDGELATEARTDVEWTIVEDEAGGQRLRIPTGSKLAAIIDGQHRLFAFTQVENPDRRQMSLICSIFLDLPKPFQAQLFATINSTQRPVNKSLTFELFGYNIADEPPEFWTPDKVAVFLSRKLATDPQSPLRGRIVIAPKRDVGLVSLGASSGWCVSTAVVVDGVLRLISSNPNRDSNDLLTPESKRRSSLEGLRVDRSPLREIYVSGNDSLLYTMLLNYLVSCDSVFWSRASVDSFIVRTVGVQALFDVFRKLCKLAYSARDIRSEFFMERLDSARAIDFASDEFRNASGSGRLAIRRAIERCVFG